MRHLLSTIRRAPLRLTAIVTMIAAAIIIPAAAFAWGPSRATFTTEDPAPYVTFNSITNNPAHGDERNFVQVKEAGAASSTYADNISLTAGKEYTVYIYYHNNAASILNDSGVGIAKDAYVKAAIPAIVKNGSTDTKAVGYVGASNANPTQVWDNIGFANTTGGDIALRYVDGSAKIYNFGTTNGATLSDSIITTGATIGFNALDGNVPGCNEYAGYVTFNIKADQPNFTIEKQVRLAGTTEWKESVEATPGATVEYQIRYQNTGTTVQNNVVLKDSLPNNMSYVADSTFIKNQSNPNGKQLSNNLVSATGINIGNYAPTGAAYVKFSAKVAANTSVFCGTSNLKNIVTAETANGSKQDDATVVVKSNNVCTEVPPELPQTGPVEMVGALIGIGALVASISYFVTSRRALQ